MTDSNTARTLVGNLTRDPQLRYSAKKGAAWTTCGMAVNQRRRRDDGTLEELPPTFYSLVCFGDLAENMAESLTKGDRVIVFGRTEEERWKGNDGSERVTTKLIADDIGASLRHGRVEVHRASRRGPTGLETAEGILNAASVDEVLEMPADFQSAG
jgi:single-strand DNA-binding protein